MHKPTRVCTSARVCGSARVCKRTREFAGARARRQTRGQASKRGSVQACEGTRAAGAHPTPRPGVTIRPSSAGGGHRVPLAKVTTVTAASEPASEGGRGAARRHVQSQREALEPGGLRGNVTLGKVAVTFPHPATHPWRHPPSGTPIPGVTQPLGTPASLAHHRQLLGPPSRARGRGTATSRQREQGSRCVTLPGG